MSKDIFFSNCYGINATFEYISYSQRAIAYGHKSVVHFIRRYSNIHHMKSAKQIFIGFNKVFVLNLRHASFISEKYLYFNVMFANKMIMKKEVILLYID